MTGNGIPPVEAFPLGVPSERGERGFAGKRGVRQEGVTPLCVPKEHQAATLPPEESHSPKAFETRTNMTTDTKTLGELLLDLVSDDEAKRNAAARQVMPMREEAQAEVRAAINQPGFPLDAWYAMLQTRMKELSEEAEQLCKQDRNHRSQTETRIRARYAGVIATEEEPYRTLIDADEWVEPGPFAQKMYARLRLVEFAETHEKKQADRLTKQYMSLSFVFRALREETLRDPEQIRVMLCDPQKNMIAEETLAKLGTAAADLFADVLLERVAVQGFRSSTTPKALRAMLAGDVTRIRNVVGWLTSDNPAKRTHGIRILQLFGNEILQIAPEVIPILFSASKNGDVGNRNGERIAALYALGSITQGTDIAVDWLLEQSESEEIWTKRACLASLGRIARQSERVVPRLIRALDDFDDPDPDSYYHGNYQVVTDALKAFGSAAAPAVPALIERISIEITQSLDSNGTRTQSPEIDPGVVSALLAIGEPAIVALPTLEKYVSQPYEELHQASNFVSLKKAIRELQKLVGR